MADATTVLAVVGGTVGLLAPTGSTILAWREARFDRHLRATERAIELMRLIDGFPTDGREYVGLHEQLVAIDLLVLLSQQESRVRSAVITFLDEKSKMAEWIDVSDAKILVGQAAASARRRLR